MHLYLKETKFIYLFNYISQHASDNNVETLRGWSVHQLVSIPYDHCTSFCNYTQLHNTANTRITNEKIHEHKMDLYTSLSISTVG